MTENYAEYKSPEERTAAFFDQDTESIAHALVGKQIALKGSGLMIIPTETEGFTREQNLPRYKKLADMNSGDLWSPPLMAGILCLIATKEDGTPGACVRLKAADLVDSKGTRRSKNASEIAKHLGLEKGEVSRIAYLDDTEKLFLIRDIATEATKPQQDEVSSEQASEIINEVFPELK